MFQYICQNNQNIMQPLTFTYSPLESDVAAVFVSFAIIAFCDLIKDQLQSQLPAHTVTHTMLSLRWELQSFGRCDAWGAQFQSAVNTPVTKNLIWSSAGGYREVTPLFIWLPLSLTGNQRTEIQHFLNLNFNQCVEIQPLQHPEVEQDKSSPNQTNTSSYLTEDGAWVVSPSSVLGDVGRNPTCSVHLQGVDCYKCLLFIGDREAVRWTQEGCAWRCRLCKRYASAGFEWIQ